jgi:hypothetical protein
MVGNETKHDYGKVIELVRESIADVNRIDSGSFYVRRFRYRIVGIRLQQSFGRGQ